MKFLFTTVAFFLLLSTVHASEFGKCADGEPKELSDSLCARINVDLDYIADTKESISLFVRKFPAIEKRAGAVWLIAGGPGEAGASFYSLLDTYRKAFPDLDLIIPDHRGTGASSTICPGESIDSIAGVTLVGEEWGQCFAHMYSKPAYVKAFSVTNAAKDLRYMLNRMSGDGKRYGYGVSYGTQLVLRTLQLEGVKFDGVILDSLVSLQDDERFDLSNRSQVMDNVGKEVLALCDQSTECAIAKELPLAEQLSHLIAKSNSLQTYSPELPNIPLSQILGKLLDVPVQRKQIPTIIRELAKGDVSTLSVAITKAGEYYQNLNKGYKNFGSSIPLVQVITASENNLRPQLSKAEVTKRSEKLLFTSPLPALMAENQMPTYEKDAYYAKLPTTLPPTLVLQGTLDPKTSLVGAKNHVERLSNTGDVNIIEVPSAAHFIALTSPMCFYKTARAFFKTEALGNYCM